jgi:protocatechuate 3,4-dioxygenase beta subunit
MSKMWTTYLCIGLAMFALFNSTLTRGAESTDTQQVTCIGKVLDEQDQPIAGANVSLHEMVFDETTYTYDPKSLGEAQTGADGAFSFVETVKDDQYRYCYIVAEKEGLALGFDNWRLRNGDKELQIKLGSPKELTGVVVDENGDPLSDARVLILILGLGEGRERKSVSGLVIPKPLTTNTDATGRFTFTRIPATATAELIVSKPGRATVNTYKRTGEPYQKLNFTEGQKDIRIIVPVEAKIEGIAVEKSTGKPVGGVSIRYTNEQETGYIRPKPFVSSEDGTFTVDALPAMRYVLALIPSYRELPDWVADPVEVITETGRTKSGVKLELSKGGVLEVKITDAVSKLPVKEVSVGVQDQARGRYQSSRSGEGGIARMRLMPGDYQVYSVHKQGYSQQRPREAVTIEDGKTQRLEYELFGMPKITGVVRDEEGKPVEGAALQVCPMGREACTSDAEGRFEAVFDPGSWSSSRVPTMYLVGAHENRNLAAAVEIGEDTRELDIELKPAVTFFGRVVDYDGLGIAGAQVRVWMRGSTWGSTLRTHVPVRTNEDGGFEFKAIPRGQKYTFYVYAEGYGENRRDDFTTANLKGDRLDVGKLALAIANLSVSGVVVDDKNQPVAGASIYCSGDGQSHSQAVSDTEGKFTLKNICAGKVRISANKSGAARSYGSIETEGGATDVRIVIGQTSSSVRYEPRRPLSLLGRPLPDMKDLNLRPPPGEIEGKRVLVCFWDMEQRPSRHCTTQLVKQAELLKSKGVVVVVVQASKVEQDALDKYVKEHNVPFSAGMVQGDAEKVRFAWGVRRLPWLILTDKDHLIVAQGFNLGDLDNQLERSSP